MPGCFRGWSSRVLDPGQPQPHLYGPAPPADRQTDRQTDRNRQTDTGRPLSPLGSLWKAHCKSAAANGPLGRPAALTDGFRQSATRGRHSTSLLGQCHSCAVDQHPTVGQCPSWQSLWQWRPMNQLPGHTPLADSPGAARGLNIYNLRQVFSAHCPLLSESHLWGQALEAGHAQHAVPCSPAGWRDGCIEGSRAGPDPQVVRPDPPGSSRCTTTQAGRQAGRQQ